MKHDPEMADVHIAIDWLRTRWDEQRTAPVRLHASHSTDGALGGLRYSAHFGAVLAWHPGEIRALDTTMLCGHPLSHGRAGDCPECEGAGVKSVRVDRYTYPMTVALKRLARVQQHGSNPHPLLVVRALATHGWRPRVVEQVIGADEAAVLRAIRQLHSRYQAGPVAWTQLSESQQRAEVA